jgi:hypothetical protein
LLLPASANPKRTIASALTPSPTCAGSFDELAEYLQKLASSSDEDAGWEEVHIVKREWQNFVRATGANVQRRNSEGAGPVNEFRVTFDVPNLGADEVLKYVRNADREGRLETTKKIIALEGREDLFYEVMKLKGGKGLFSKRDFLLQEVVGDNYVVRRSYEDDEFMSAKKSLKKKCVRADVKFSAWFVTDMGAAGSRVVYLEHVIYGGPMPGQINLKSVPSMLQDKVDDVLCHAKEKSGLDMGAVFGEGGGEDDDVGSGLEMGAINNPLRDAGAADRLRAISSGQDLGGGLKKKGGEAGDRARFDSLGKGGFHNKPTQGGGRLGKKTGGDNATLPEVAAAPPPPPTKETTWVQHVDEKSGHPFYESGVGETSWDEPFAREGSAWRSLVDGRVVHEAPQNVI